MIDLEQLKHMERIVMLVGPTNSSQGVGRAVFLLALAIGLSGCGRGGVSNDTRFQDNDVQAEKAPLRDSEVNAAIAGDPSLQGNEVFVPEYGENQTVPDRSSLPPSHPAPLRKMLRGAAIRLAVVGHELTDGVHWSWKFKSGGRLLTDDVGTQGTSHWRVDEDKLCIDDVCHTVSRDGRYLRLWRDGVVAFEAELR